MEQISALQLKFQVLASAMNNNRFKIIETRVESFESIIEGNGFRFNQSSESFFQFILISWYDMTARVSLGISTFCTTSRSISDTSA